MSIYSYIQLITWFIMLIMLVTSLVTYLHSKLHQHNLREMPGSFLGHKQSIHWLAKESTWMYQDVKFRGTVNFLSEISNRTAEQTEELPEFPIVLSENFPEWNGFLPNLGAAAPCPHPLLESLWVNAKGLYWLHTKYFEFSSHKNSIST